MPDINKAFEKQHLQALKRYQKQVTAAYEQTINSVFQAYTGLTPRRETFRVTDYPALETILDRELEKLATILEGIVVNGIEGQWNLSADKFGALVDQRYKGEIPAPLKRTIYDPNQGALNAFIQRTTNGLTLSERIWKNLAQFRSEIEQGLYLGISEGVPAKKMATQMKQYLNEPDKLFRRVRDAKGNLKLSKAAQEYKPGQGVYRSSYKNALRITRTETNMAYRASDHERWKRTPFVTGIEVKLSNAHPRPDICDSLKGIYPKDFKFVGWHPNCICFSIPVLPTEEEYSKYEDALLEGTDESYQFKSAVSEPPKGFVKYYSENKATIAGYKSEPYWIKDNPGYLNGSKGVKPAVVKEASKTEVPGFVPAKSISEAVTRIKNTGVGDVNLGSATLSQVNTVLDALESEANYGKLNISTFSLQRGIKSSNNAGNGIVGGQYRVSDRSLKINLEQFDSNYYKPVKSLEDEIAIRQKRIVEIDESIKGYKARLGVSPARDKAYKKDIKQAEFRKQDFEFQIRRFKADIAAGKENIPNNVIELLKTTEEQVKSTVIHEIGHHRDYHFLKATDNSLYSTYGKPASIYGSYGDEFLAEWYAKFRMFGSEGVPEDLLKLFNTIK